MFHHVYDPSGKFLVTKGVGGLFTHHRGLFYGFMKATYGKNTVDIWHCKGDTHQAHRTLRHRRRPGPGRRTVWRSTGTASAEDVREGAARADDVPRAPAGR